MAHLLRLLLVLSILCLAVAIAYLGHRLSQATEEVKQVRTQFPQMIETITQEVEQVRLIMPEVLEESQALRDSLPPNMSRAEDLMTRAEGLAQTAGEDAVAGLFTGILKTPVSFISNVGKKTQSVLGLGDKDVHVVENAVLALLNSGDIKKTQNWENPSSGSKGTITLLDQTEIDGLRCHQLNIEIEKRLRNDKSHTLTACLNSEGKWYEREESS